jgi:hypothetical protein
MRGDLGGRRSKESSGIAEALRERGNGAEAGMVISDLARRIFLGTPSIAFVRFSVCFCFCRFRGATASGRVFPKKKPSVFYPSPFYPKRFYPERGFDMAPMWIRHRRCGFDIGDVDSTQKA